MTDRVVFFEFVVSAQGVSADPQNPGDCRMVGAPKYSGSKKFSWAGDILQAIHKEIQHYHGSNYGLPEERRVSVVRSRCQGSRKSNNE